MKKLFTILMAMLLITGLTACSKKATVEEIAEKEKTDVVVEADENFIYVDMDQVKDGDVEFKLEDGTTVTVNSNINYTSAGKYQTEVTYTNSKGESRTENVTVVVDNSENIKAEKENQTQASTDASADSNSAATEGESTASRNYEVEIDGTVWGAGNLYTADIETCEKWVQAVFGDVTTYRIEKGGSGKTYVFVNYFSGMTCDDISFILGNVKANGGHISIATRGDDVATGGDSKLSACGF